MATPRIKVFDAYGQYQASTHDYAAAAVMMGLYGEGATVRLGHSKKDIVWIEGANGEAARNFDLVGEAINAHDARQDIALQRMMRA